VIVALPLRRRQHRAVDDDGGLTGGGQEPLPALLVDQRQRLLRHYLPAV
jgi:hypothetical protein